MDLSAHLVRAELLHVAIVRNSYELVRELLDTYHLDPNLKSSQGLVPLHLAAWEGNVAMVVCLLTHGAAVGLTEETTGWTALHLAARRGHEEVFAALVEAGGDLRARDCFGCSVLSHAVVGGSTAIVRFLLQSGLDANLQPLPPQSCTAFSPLVAPCASALHSASARGDVELLQLLLDHGSHTNLRDHTGRTPLDCAVLHLQQDAVALLLAHDRSGIDSSDMDGRTALHHAVDLALRAPREEARGVAWSVAELLLSHGANVEAKDKQEMTPLSLAAAYGTADSQRRLVCLAQQHKKRTASSVICLSVIGLATGLMMLTRLRGS